MTKYKLIEREPTREMRKAGEEVFYRNSPITSFELDLPFIFEAMFDAAPDIETEAEKRANVFIKSEDERKTVVGRAAPGVKQYYESLEIIRALLQERGKK